MPQQDDPSFCSDIIKLPISITKIDKLIDNRW